ncbi:uncharacterized protein LOC130647084 isoform X2 [Hydractinia symbiolongicarpus]|nr:uncharacterized protein LOC130647084 isoform X2 [Hydractinia symbiolongicarpus]
MSRTVTDKYQIRVTIQSEDDLDLSNHISKLIEGITDCLSDKRSICQIKDVLDTKFNSKVILNIEQVKNRMVIAGIGFSQRRINMRRRERRSPKVGNLRVKIRVRRSGVVLMRKSKQNATITSNSTGDGRNTSGNRMIKKCLIDGKWMKCLGPWTPRPTTTCIKGFRCIASVTAVKKSRILPPTVLIGKKKGAPGKRTRRTIRIINVNAKRFSHFTVKKSLKHITTQLKSVIMAN